MKKLSLVLLIIFSFSCKKNIKTIQVNSDTKEYSERTDNLIKENLNQVEYVDTLYVIAKSGLTMRDSPSLEAAKLGTLPYGKQVYVLNKEGESIKIKDQGKEVIGEFISIYEYISNESNSEYKKVYVFSSFLGEFDEVKLDNTQLCETTLYNFKDLFHEEECIKEKEISLKLVNESFSPLKSKIKFTSDIKKNNGILKIPNNKKGFIIFTDNISDDDSYKKYEYIGFSKSLKYHLVYVSYYEGSEFFLVNPNNNEKQIKFIGYPFVSPNNKTIIAYYANPYESNGELEIFTIDKGQITKIFYGVFKNWMPTDTEKISWINDTSVIISVSHSKAFWTPSGDLNTQNIQSINISW